MTDETRICSDCGYRNPHSTVYCIKCGNRLYDNQAKTFAVFSWARWIKREDSCSAPRAASIGSRFYAALMAC